MISIDSDGEVSTRLVPPWSIPIAQEPVRFPQIPPDWPRLAQSRAESRSLRQAFWRLALRADVTRKRHVTRISDSDGHYQSQRQRAIAFQLEWLKRSWGERQDMCSLHDVVA